MLAVFRDFLDAFGGRGRSQGERCRVFFVIWSFQRSSVLLGQMDCFERKR